MNPLIFDLRYGLIDFGIARRDSSVSSVSYGSWATAQRGERDDRRLHGSKIDRALIRY